MLKLKVDNKPYFKLKVIVKNVYLNYTYEKGNDNNLIY